MIRLEKKILVFPIHGIGNWDEKNSKKWFQPMQDEAMDLAWKLSDKQMQESFVDFYPITWGPKIQEIENRYIEKVEEHIPKGGFFPFNLSRNINNGIRRTMVDSYGDIMSSHEGYGQRIIENCIRDTMMQARKDSLARRIAKGLPEDSQTLAVLIGHSLGSIIIFNYCHKIGKAAHSQNPYEIEQIRGGLRLNSIIIYGSPITLWDYMSGGAITPQFPSWAPLTGLTPAIINIWCERDPLSAPLVISFKDRYSEDKVILKDRLIKVPGFIGKIPVASHGNYQRSRDAAFEIAKRIHLIWSVLRTDTLISN